MELALHIAVGLFCLPLTLLGLRSVARPVSMGSALAIDPQGAAGLNTIRGVLGGFFLSCVAMLATGLISGDTRWFLAVAVLMTGVAVGRVIGIAADGFDRTVVPPLAIELVIAGVLVTAHLAG